MSKTMTISNRINIALALVAVFLLILGTNRIDKRHFETAQNAVTSVYNDRVLAQDYIYKMNNLIHKKQRHLMDGSRTANTSTNKEIETLIALFSDTELTVNEVKTFKSFRSDFDNLKAKEAKYYENANAQGENRLINETSFKTPFDEDLEALQTDLNNLALIQVSESKSIMEIAQKSLNVNKLMSSMEIYVLLVVGIIILVVTFYRIEKS
tara:strand:+ start:1583 stop:2212 length:630 start_codon:yes stop_codon:yes gene_type:complete